MRMRPAFGRLAARRDSTAEPHGGPVRRRTPLVRFLALLAIFAGAPAAAQGPAPKAEAPAARMVVEARELDYDETKNIVSARGDVQIYYKGRLLEADRVIYDRNTQRVYAEGHARLTETDGTIVHAERFDLTDDFKNGFIESLQADTPDNTQFSAPRAERLGGVSTVFDLGSYTACEACKDDPSRPRTWRVRAKRIIHDNVEKMIYYEDATLEFFDMPIAYMPFWSAPDPTVKRKSGILTPVAVYRSQLGYGVGLPLYWAMAPDYDLTITPTYFTRQGPYLSGEFRERFENGGFNVTAEGTHVGDPGAFAAAPLGAGDRRWRGAAHSAGEFALNDEWKVGWDVTALSDRYFIQDYKQHNTLFGSYFFREQASTAYLTGQGDRSYFDLRGYYFEGLSPNDVQSQMPIVHPMIDYNRDFDIDPEKTWGLGGMVTVDGNFTSTSAQTANYESIQPRTLDSIYGLYNVCQVYAPAANQTQSGCLLRGIGGDYESATLEGSWKRRVIDPLGGVWEPFAFARFFGSYLNYDTSGVAPIYNAAYQPLPNSAQGLFVNGADNSFRGQATPGVGAEWRYPVLAHGPLGDLVAEPIAQIVARPSQTSIPSLVNMDAQSLVFDDTNLFEWNKFSGYDRFETGTRLNYGGQATLTLDNGAYFNGLVGQSRQLAGPNAYATPDAANVGLSSGLDTRTSDIVGRLAFAPTSTVTFVGKGRFDADDLRARRIDAFTSIKLDPLLLEVHYANYQAQPEIGFDKRRQGLALNARWGFAKNYFVTGNITFDMSRYLYNSLTTTPLYNASLTTNPYFSYYALVTPYSNTSLTGVNLNGTAPVFSIAAMGFGAGYQDECTTLMVNYTSIYQPQGYTGLPARNQTIMATLQLRTLGNITFGTGLSSVLLNDGVRAQP
jgi:LPS-assembly protein